MRNAAYALITLSFLAASYVSVLDVRTVSWPQLVGALLPGVVGLVLVRVARASEASDETRREAGLQKLRESLALVVERTDALWDERNEVFAYDYKDRIDADLVGPLGDFVEARESMIDAFGLQAYADVMSDFAAGERCINRVWSASVDGYIDEIKTYLERARDQFRDAKERLDSLS